MLTTTVFLPLVGALAILLFASAPRTVRRIAAGVAVVDLLLSLVVFFGYDKAVGGFQFIDRYADWIPLLNIEYHLAVDGLSAPLILLTGLLGLAAVYSSWSVDQRHKEYFAWLLTLQTAVMGVFAAQDFILFFIFWELELVPMYFLISIWGSGRRAYSAMKFVMFTFTGSAFMLVGILVVFFATDTFSMTRLATMDLAQLSLPVQMVFAFFFIGFAVKLPIWPLHTWLPDAHTDAPTAVSVMLAGVLLKMGGYGLIRVNVGMFPAVAQGAALAIAILAVINIAYGAMVTFRQTDLKRLIANSSVSHMGFVLLGISSIGAASGTLSPVGLTGAALQMFTHGTITGLLFVGVGLVYDRAHTRHIPDLGGLASRMPFIAVVFMLAGLASLGLPATSGFAAEVMVFLGTFGVWGAPTAIGVLGVLMTAGYVLWALQRVLFGPAVERWRALPDATRVEGVAPVLLGVAIMLVGLYPAVLTDVFGVGVGEILPRLTQ